MSHGLRINDEAGAMMVMFAISLLLLLLAASFAIDVTNVHRHKRQLQTMADAAVLAAASRLSTECASSADVKSAGETFAGIPTATYNRPPAEADSGTISHEWITTDPCAEGAVEIKVTETGLKWLFPLTAIAGVLRADLTKSASARAELMQVAGQEGTLPIAVEEEEPIIDAWAWMVDEDDADAPIAGTIVKLEAGTAAGDVVPWTSTTPISRTVTEANLGIRVAVDRGTASSCAVVSADCATTACASGAVECFDAGGSQGLLHVHAFEQVAAEVDDAPPALERVVVTPDAPCTGNAYFNDAGCTYTVEALVDWDSDIEGSQSEADARATINGTVGGADVELSPTADPKVWTGSTTDATTGTDPASVRLAWTQRHGRVSPTKACGKKKNAGGKTENIPGHNNTPGCEGAWNGSAAAGVLDLDVDDATPVHRLFLKSTDRSGDIDSAQVTEGGTIANSIDRGAAHDLTVTVNLPAPLGLGSKRVLSTKAPGSNDGHLDCDPLGMDPEPLQPAGDRPTGGQPLFIYQLVHGCNGPRYEETDIAQSDCPDPASYGPEDNWLCVAGATGEMTQALDRGLSERLYGTTTPTPAQCAAYAPDFDTYYDGKDDPRAVPVMIVSASSLAAEGTAHFPVRTFAWFYILGWGGNQQMDYGGGCTENELAEQGTIIGRFIKHTLPGDGSAYGSAACDPTELGGCVPVMTE